ncbi:MAG: hypothetical protein HYY06_14685 [Deltaproteobacteria bacterium]|nr:hypothetical protein [Deltaproteobacteria bacterium]
MERFRLDFERSLALHEAVAQEVLLHPEIIERARRKLEEWLRSGGRSAPLWLRWQRILERPTDEVAAFLMERSEEAAWLRKASPFAGVLPPGTRLRILRGVRERLGRMPG